VYIFDVFIKYVWFDLVVLLFYPMLIVIWRLFISLPHVQNRLGRLCILGMSQFDRPSTAVCVLEVRGMTKIIALPMINLSKSGSPPR